MPDTRGIDSIIQRAVDLAADSSRIVGCDHLCEALLSDPFAQMILESIGENRIPVPVRIPERSERESSREYSITPGARRILEIAKGEARRLADASIGPEHLLVGLLMAGEEAIRGPAWFPYVGAVASRREVDALTGVIGLGTSAQKVRFAIDNLPRRTLLRSVGESSDNLLRPAAGNASGENLLRSPEFDES